MHISDKHCMNLVLEYGYVQVTSDPYARNVYFCDCDRYPDLGSRLEIVTEIEYRIKPDAEYVYSRALEEYLMTHP